MRRDFRNEVTGANVKSVSCVRHWSGDDERQKDGSFLVDVSLVHLYTGHGSHYFHFAGQKAQGWEVVATVASKNGRFVVDDVRTFDSDSTEGPSHQLSDAFVGCEGPHWTGLAATK